MEYSHLHGTKRLERFGCVLVKTMVWYEIMPFCVSSFSIHNLIFLQLKTICDAVYSSTRNVLNFVFSTIFVTTSLIKKCQKKTAEKEESILQFHRKNPISMWVLKVPFNFCAYHIEIIKKVARSTQLTKII